MRGAFRPHPQGTRRLLGGIQNMGIRGGSAEPGNGPNGANRRERELHQSCSILCSCPAVLIKLFRFFVRNFEFGNNSPSRGV